MRQPTNRTTVDLSQYPDLVVIYLGMRVNRLAGLKAMLGFGPISSAVAERPDGLLLHEPVLRRGGMEAVYVGTETPVGLARFAPVQGARGSMFSARRRAGIAGEPAAGPIREDEFYGQAGSK